MHDYSLYSFCILKRAMKLQSISWSFLKIIFSYNDPSHLYHLITTLLLLYALRILMLRGVGYRMCSYQSCRVGTYSNEQQSTGAWPGARRWFILTFETSNQISWYARCSDMLFCSAILCYTLLRNIAGECKY